MKKKIILFIICIVLIAIILGIFLFHEDIETNGHENAVNYLASDISNQKEVKEIVEDTTITFDGTIIKATDTNPAQINGIIQIRVLDLEGI